MLQKFGAERLDQDREGTIVAAALAGFKEPIMNRRAWVFIVFPLVSCFWLPWWWDQGTHSCAPHGYCSCMLAVLKGRTWRTCASNNCAMFLGLLLLLSWEAGTVAIAAGTVAIAADDGVGGSGALR